MSELDNYKLYSVYKFADLVGVPYSFLREQIKRGKLETYNGKLSFELFKKMKPDNELHRHAELTY